MESCLWFMWVVAGVSLVGVVLNIFKRRCCFLVWIFTNGAWCWYDFSIEAFAQSGLVFVYLGLSVWGFFKWQGNVVKGYPKIAIENNKKNKVYNTKDYQRFS